MENAKKLIWPDYENCNANLPNSILRYFGAETAGKTLPLLDRYLDKEYKNVVVFLLDGMGKAIVERHLAENGPFRSNQKGIYRSVFLSTTVAATTSIMSGLQPCEHSWLGWDCYYPQVDKNITVFFNYEQGTETPAADYDVPRTVTPYETVFDRIHKVGKQAYMFAPFWEPKTDDIGEMCERVRGLCGEPGQKYIYVYWNQPDGLLHKTGCGSEEVHEAMLTLEATVSALAESLEDSLVIVTADHGHIDTEAAELYDYPELTDCLIRRPSLEPRVLNLFVKEEKKEFFEREWDRLFGDRFLLMPTEEVIERKLMGTGQPHAMFRRMLGDYLAIATGDLTIFYSGTNRWLSNHGSLTEDEMLIPLIVFEKG